MSRARFISTISATERTIIMPDSTAIKHVCIHGHFYQPPRANPWLEEIEQEETAAPLHDWNQRIHSECYRSNGAARVVGEENRILNLYNNYLSMSFNFGPTLIEWIERYDPEAYRAITEADSESTLRNNGHGNALAQVYSHLIMPLANSRDKKTQVLWGIRDFVHRFKRPPEGMWLAETAVDLETLRLMADAGIKFTILSPFQGARWRRLEKNAQWNRVVDGNIPTGRAYRCELGDGKYIHIFFYNAELARGIAFERLLEHSSRLLSKINDVYDLRDPARPEPWLVQTATDGESYGHHFQFGDMALAAAFLTLEKEPHTRITNYGNFLASFPVVAEVEINEMSSWSCAHGVARWQSDCGCHIGGPAHWNQKWRAPLREAMNFLRDSLAAHYEQAMRRLCRDPWAARDDYVDVLLDPEANCEKFTRKHLMQDAQSQAPLFFQLLEMQRCALLMFTSCGWFFDEISNLESVLIMKYAARAMQLAEATGGPSLEPEFLRILKKAPCNLSEFKDGADVFLRKVAPEIIRKDRVAANYAIQSLALYPTRQFRIYCYEIIPIQEIDLGSKPVPCFFGQIRVRDSRTRDERDFIFAALHFGGLDFRCSIKPFVNSAEYEAILTGLEGAVEEQSTVRMIRILDEFFGKEFFTLHDVFRDLRSSLAIDIGMGKLANYHDILRHLYQCHSPLLESLRQWGINIPSDVKTLVRTILKEEILQNVSEILAHEQQSGPAKSNWAETDFFFRAHLGRLNSLVENARAWKIELQLDEVASMLGSSMVKALSALIHSLDTREAGLFHRLTKVCETLGIKAEIWTLQTLYFKLVKKAATMTEGDPFEGFPKLLEELDIFLHCRFAKLLDQSRLALSTSVVPRQVLKP